MTTGGESGIRTVARRPTRPVAAEPPFPPAPRLQLATLTQTPPDGAGWLHEVKLDGYRIAATLVAGRCRLTTRNLLDWTHRFPAIAAAVRRLPVTSAVLDGEVVALANGDRTDFAALQRWLSRQRDGAWQGNEGRGRTPVVYQAFDLLNLDGLDLRDLPLLRRKELLERLLSQPRPGARSPLRFTEHLLAPGPQVLRAACRLGLEGVVSKRVDARYRPGRNDDWLKATCLASGDFVIGGFTHPRGSRTGLGALLLGEVDEGSGSLRYVGKVGTGFDDATLSALTSRLRRLARGDSPFSTAVPGLAISAGVTWVEPRLLAEVTYVDRTHAGLLRQARFHSLRDDKRRHEHAAEGQDLGSRPTMELSGVTLTNPDRVLYPDQGITKLRLAQYYADVGPALVRWAGGRPLSLVRCPEGSEAQCFYQKHPGAGFAAPLPRVPIEESEGIQDYVYLESPADLIALVQAGVLEIHAWNSTVDDLERPDMLVFDLDPSDGVDFGFTKATARALRQLLARLELTAFLRTTGGKGLHVVVPLTPRSDWDGVKAFARGVAELLAGTDPERLTTAMSKQKRAGKLFIDYLRNARGATAIANFSTRARLGAPVAVPLRWSELARLESSNAYDIDSVRRRLSSLKSDPWEGFDQARRPLPTLEDAP